MATHEEIEAKRAEVAALAAAAPTPEKPDQTWWENMQKAEQELAELEQSNDPA